MIYPIEHVPSISVEYRIGSFDIIKISEVSTVSLYRFRYIALTYMGRVQPSIPRHPCIVYANDTQQKQIGVSHEIRHRFGLICRLSV